MKKKLSKLIYIAAIFFSAFLFSTAKAATDQYSWPGASQQLYPVGTPTILYNSSTTYTAVCDNPHILDAFGNDIGTSTGAANISFNLGVIYGPHDFITSSTSSGVQTATFVPSTNAATTSANWVQLKDGSGTTMACIGTNKLQISDSTTAPAAELSFFYPQNGSSTPLFANWLLTAANVNDNDYYRTSIDWYADGAPLLTASKFQWGRDIKTDGITIPRTHWSFDFATGTTIYASAKLYDTSAANGDSLASPVLVASANIQFTLQSIPQSGGFFAIDTFPLNASGTIATSTGAAIASSTAMAQETNATSTNILDCVPAADWTDIGGGLSFAACKAGSFLFRPSEGSVDRLAADFARFKGVFPFAYFFKITDAIMRVVNDTASSSTTGSINITLPLGVGTIPVLTSNTLSDVAGSDFKDWFFTFQKWAAWIAVSLLIIYKIR